MTELESTTRPTLSVLKPSKIRPTKTRWVSVNDESNKPPPYTLLLIEQGFQLDDGEWWKQLGLGYVNSRGWWINWMEAQVIDEEFSGSSVLNWAYISDTDGNPVVLEGE